MSDALTVHAALAQVMRDVKAVGKDGVNKAQGFNFRGIDGVLNAVGPALRDHGVIVFPIVEDATYNSVEVGKNRTLMREVTMRVRYTFVGPDGSSLDAVVVAESMDSGDKATSKCMSVAFRTVLLQVLAIPTDEPDPDTHSYERAAVPEVDPKHALVVQQKRQLVAACGGDGDMAKQLWGESSEPLSDEALAKAIETAGEMIADERGQI